VTTNAPLSLAAQIAMTLASICECRHLVTMHDARGCSRCECGEFTRRTQHDAIVTRALGEESR